MWDIILSDGFYDLENDGIRDFRWMKQHGEVVLSKDGEYIKFDVAGQRGQILQVNDEDFDLVGNWQTIIVPIQKLEQHRTVNFALNCLMEGVNDNRELGIMLSNFCVLSKHELSSVLFYKGFYANENDGRRDFCWMQKSGKLIINNKIHESDYLLMDVASTCDSECITLEIISKKHHKKIQLFPGWNRIGVSCLEFGLSEKDVLDLKCNWKLTKDNENRELSLMVSRVEISVPNEYDVNSIKLHDSLFTKTKCDTYAWCFACDTSTVCNLRCAFCTLDLHIRKNLDAPKGIELCKKQIWEYLPYASKIQPYLSGEPFAREDMWQVIEENDKFMDLYPFKEVEFSTNGLLLDKKMRQRIIRSSITSLLISFNAATGETYKRISGGDFSRLVDNVRNLVLENKEAKNTKLRISLSYVLMRENVEELPEFIKIAHELDADSVQIWPLNSNSMGIEKRQMQSDFLFYYKQQSLIYYPNLTKEKLEQAKELADKLNVIIGDLPAYSFDFDGEKDIEYPLSPQEFDKYIMQHNLEYSRDFDGKKIRESNNFSKCYYPWESFYILTDGSFAPCLHLIYKGGIGNIVDEGIQGAWNSERMQLLRKNIMAGKVDPLCRDTQCPFI